MSVRYAEPKRGDAPGAPRGWAVRPHPILLLALLLVLAQAGVRGALALGGNLYWDDLILTGRSAALPLLSPEFLLYNHDGHVMPAAFLVAGLTTTVAPLQWWAAAVTLIVLQLVAALAVLRVLWLLLGPRPALLAVLAMYLFTPLTVPSFAWWAAGLNSLPLQAALAWVAGDALLLARTGRRRYVVTGAVVTAVGLMFFEKSVLVPFVAFAVVALAARGDGAAAPLRTAWRTGRGLWLAAAGVVAVWSTVYLAVADTGLRIPAPADALRFAHHGTSLGVLPTLLGGPWRWERWPPGPPWAAPPAGLVVAGWVVVVAGLFVVLRVKQRTGWVIAAMVGYVAASEAAMMVARSGPDTTYELAQTLRYTSDSAVVLALGLALIVRAPWRPDPGRCGAIVRRAATPAVATAVVAGLVASSVWSTVTFARSWNDNPGAEYLETARASLSAHRDVPLLDQPVSLMALLPVAAPWNGAAHVFAPLPERPDFAETTPELRALDESGRLVQATVQPVRWTEPGPDPGCGTRIGAAGGTVGLGGPLMIWQWTAQLNYHATAGGAVAVGLGAGEPVSVPVRAGLNTVFVRLYGTGSTLSVRPLTPGLELCVGSGPVGVVLPGTQEVR
ncbi:hypothetical protein ACFWPA_18075 [Rhodococcus sp. NPDC058505]|uniref:hypothetical protein n=1 Tax=unclassified Rhodococcus (in: high G+C Gram-positive bacteria) TaxID=192944 RepID=UPI003654370F